MIYIASAVLYLAWRTTIINPDALFLSGMYYFSDVIAVLLGAVTIFVSWNHRHRRSPPVGEGLTVDVFVPTYREPVDMVRRTVEAALAIGYPHETWLLDDGNRPAMRAMAAELGCHYLARADNSGAKAGNLNHALSRSKGEFIAVFDADHIPQNHALDATLGFFADPRVAMVQTPQDYYNIDALQYMNPRRGGGLWHDQSFFYNLSQPGRDYHNAASCAGTSVVYRRSALEAIGGVPTETVTEDVHTSLKLQKAGFTVPYLNEPIAHGIAAADLADYYRTRLRYGHGNIHALRREKILTCPNLTLRQRLSYLFLGLIYLEGWQQLMVFLVPTMALILGWAPFQITILNVVIVLLYPLWSYLLMQEIGCGFSRYWTAEVYSMMRFPVHLLASAGLFRNRVVWQSSQKNVEGRLNLRLLVPQLAVLVVSVVAIVVGFYRLGGEYTPGPLLAAIVDRLPDRQSLAEDYRDVTRFFSSAADEVVALVSPSKPKVQIPPTPAAGAPGPEAPSSVPSSSPQGNEAPAAPTTTPPATTPMPAVMREAPPPIDWNEPLTKGYTIDLVLIAGFWALFNALRVIFVLIKVTRNARLTRSDYLFRTIAPIRIETSDGPRYVVAERLSMARAVIRGALGGLSEEDLAASLKGTVFLATGTAQIVLRPDEDWISRPNTRAGEFQINCASEASRRILESGLYATSWHRQCNNNDAEFMTPLAALSRLFGQKTRDRTPWQAALILDDDWAEPRIALLRHDSELLLLAEAEPRKSVARVIVVDRRGWTTRLFLLRQLVGTEPLHSAASQSRKVFHYQVEVSADSANVAVLRRRPRRVGIRPEITTAAPAGAKAADRASAT